jgi:signal transduction histidine kinase
MAAGTIEECDRLLDMINTMLVISRTEAGVSSLEKKQIDFSAVLRDACDLFQSAAEDKGITLFCQAIEKIWIHGDIRLIQRMIANLLDNAIKFTPPGGRVDVSISTDNNHRQVPRNSIPRWTHFSLHA